MNSRSTAIEIAATALFTKKDKTDMKNNAYLLCVVLLAVVTARAFPAADAASPNIVLLFTDDQGYQDIGCFGSPKIRTPNLDKMAAEGRKFTDFYVAAPICSASRAALLTGCYCQRVSVTGVYFPKHKVGLNPDEITIADMLKAKGYATACIGKWHLGHKPPFLPTKQGFDTYFGIPYSNDMTHDPTMKLAETVNWLQGATKEQFQTGKPKRNWAPLMRDEEVIEYPVDQSTLTKRSTEEAVKFISANKEKPFFLYMPYTMPHVPLFASADFEGKSPRGLYGDVIEEIDWSVGEILKTLKEAGLDENTLVVYTSDNGPWLSKGTNGGSALPLRSGKFTTYEGGMREPCIMRWPGKIPAGTVCGEIAATIDLLPTFAAVAGVEAPNDRVIDGHDILTLMNGDADAKSPHDAYYFYRGNALQAIRMANWKLHMNGNNSELYDLAADISESNNLAAANPEVVARLKLQAEKFNTKLMANRRPAGKMP
jgi:arylsulfatase A